MPCPYGINRFDADTSQIGHPYNFARWGVFVGTQYIVCPPLNDTYYRLGFQRLIILA